MIKLLKSLTKNNVLLNCALLRCSKHKLKSNMKNEPQIILYIK